MPGRKWLFLMNSAIDSRKPPSFVSIFYRSYSDSYPLPLYSDLRLLLPYSTSSMTTELSSHVHPNSTAPVCLPTSSSWSADESAYHIRWYRPDCSIGKLLSGSSSFTFGQLNLIGSRRWRELQLQVWKLEHQASGQWLNRSGGDWLGRVWWYVPNHKGKEGPEEREEGVNGGFWAIR